MILPPIHRQIVVPAPADEAFAVFTEQIGMWWPVGRFSLYGPDTTPAFRDGRLIETGPAGDEAEWGRVVAWEPPYRLRMTWHPGGPADRAGEVEVGFAPVTDALTLVTVTHSGWERLADPASSRREYGNGWPVVLRGYAALLPGAPSSADPVWLVLVDTPAPGVDRPAEHPGFRGHPDFLARLRQRGALVAAGPIAASGEGMTVVRVPARETGAVLAAATEQDASVTDGVLEVRVRPWLVTVTGPSLA